MRYAPFQFSGLSNCIAPTESLHSSASQAAVQLQARGLPFQKKWTSNDYLECVSLRCCTLNAASLSMSLHAYPSCTCIEKPHSQGQGSKTLEPRNSKKRGKLCYLQSELVLLTVKLFAYTPLRPFLDALSNCKQKGSNCKLGS